MPAKRSQPRPTQATGVPTGRGGSCPACGSDRLRAAFAVGSYEFCRCAGCGSLHLSVVPAPAELLELYEGPDYFENPMFGGDSYHGYRDYEADRAHIVSKFDAVLARIESLRPPGRLLDVGCGPGAMLEAAAARGWRARGIDLNPWAVREARERRGLEVDAGTLPDPALPSEDYDALTMMDLLEHVPEPGALVAEAGRLLRPDGVLAILTPDAGSLVSRALGNRWPEALRAPEHLVLFSAQGLAALLGAHGFEVIGFHSIGKTSSLATLAADVAPVAPAILDRLAAGLEESRLGRRTVDLDPRTKLCLYARLPRAAAEPAEQRMRTRRLPRRPPPQPAPEAVLDDLHALARARGLRQWLFERLCGGLTLGSAAEVGAGIGTFTSSLLQNGAGEVLALEPDPVCRRELRRALGADPRLQIESDAVPGSERLRSAAGTLDLVVCQNVLEHVDDHVAAIGEMAGALKPGGTLALLVPAHPSLYGALDLAYGHRRRYTSSELGRLLNDAGLRVDRLEHVNLLGVIGWWVSNKTGRAGIGSRAVALYELLLRIWRPLEDAARPQRGLSLVARASRPQSGASGR